MITLKKLLKIYKTKTNIAEVLGVSSQAVGQWIDVPPCQVIMLKYIIAPDLFQRDRLPPQFGPRMRSHHKIMKDLARQAKEADAERARKKAIERAAKKAPKPRTVKKRVTKKKSTRPDRLAKK